jgi:CRISPR/Cas system-associated endonuclease Cas1
MPLRDSSFNPLERGISLRPVFRLRTVLLTVSIPYALVVGLFSSALSGAGLDPRIGLFHGLRYGRASLPLDLVEELRASLADRFVLRMLNLNQLQSSDFVVQPDSAVQLRPEVRRSYLFAWEEYITQPNAYFRREEPKAIEDEFVWLSAFGETTENRLSWKDRIERQVRRCKSFLQNQEPYTPLLK